MSIVQLSRSLFSGQSDTRTDCLSAEDSNTQCSRGQQVDNDVDDVSRLPHTVVVECPSSDIIQRLAEKRREKHDDALKQLETELTQLSQVCEAQVTSISQEMMSTLQEVNVKPKTLKDTPIHPVYLQQLQDEMKRIMELKHKLTECESQCIKQIRAVLRKYCHLLEKISFLLPPDVHRLIHSIATMVNQSLLVNRRKVARLLLLLQHQQNLQQHD
ncbi:coiled-coil domain-containing protein 180 isoform X2 [Hippoglossus stenolepis]|uniref:coiled-coil domain-containing protein 180 isoform X2 n=1 Tax=Hippoglossus stenolepis TaxID=195615 RepID=UPI001FAEAA4E|nr:coiled-coil domain-containing protein 180 isoform X2 [Hippoglossus stenolepis]